MDTSRRLRRTGPRLGIARRLIIAQAVNILLHIGGQERREVVQDGERLGVLSLQRQRDIDRDLHVLRRPVAPRLTLLRVAPTATRTVSALSVPVSRERSFARVGGRILGVRRCGGGEIEVKNASELEEAVRQEGVRRKEARQLVHLGEKGGERGTRSGERASSSFDD